MASTSRTSELARRVIDTALTHNRIDEPAADELIAAAGHDPEAARDLFRIVVERMGDGFEPRLTELYLQFFTRAVASVEPSLQLKDLLARYALVREPRPITSAPRNIFVFSRITLGADVVVTSTVMRALLTRFPQARVHFVGPRKNYDLFAGEPRIQLLEFNYPRGGALAERIAITSQLRALIAQPDSIVIDPDSRLTQLGLLPVADPDRYFLFESRTYGADTDESLAELTSRWTYQTIGVAGEPFVAPAPVENRPEITVSLGVGDNHDKCVAPPFERELFRALAGRDVLADLGAGGRETERVLDAIGDNPSIKTFQGPYAPFAAAIRQSRLFVGYDSVGQHVAAACGVPLICIFAGHVSDRMFARWRPTGPGPIEIVKVQPAEAPEEVLARVLPLLRQA